MTRNARTAGGPIVADYPRSDLVAATNPLVTVGREFDPERLAAYLGRPPSLLELLAARELRRPTGCVLVGSAAPLPRPVLPMLTEVSVSAAPSPIPGGRAFRQSF